MLYILKLLLLINKVAEASLLPTALAYVAYVTSARFEDGLVAGYAEPLIVMLSFEMVSFSL